MPVPPPKQFILLKEDRPVDITLRRWGDMMREVNTQVGKYWHKEMFPDHFKPGADTRYKHDKRSRAYMKRKARLADRGIAKRVSGQLVDNVLTGRMRAALKRSRITRGYPSRLTVTMYGPNYLTIRYWKKKQPEKVRELTALTQDQADKLATRHSWLTVRAIAKTRGTRTTRY